MAEQSPAILGWLLVTALWQTLWVVPWQHASAIPYTDVSPPAGQVTLADQSAVIPAAPNCHDPSAHKDPNGSPCEGVDTKYCTQCACALGHCCGLLLMLSPADVPLTRDWLPALVVFDKDRVGPPELKPPRQLRCA